MQKIYIYIYFHCTVPFLDVRNEYSSWIVASDTQINISLGINRVGTSGQCLTSQIVLRNISLQQSLIDTVYKHRGVARGWTWVAIATPVLWLSIPLAAQISSNATPIGQSS